MTLTALVAYIRTIANDTVSPYAVSNTRLQQYISEAENEAAERGLYLRTGAAHNIAVLSGTASYTLAASIIFIERAKLASATQPLIKTGKADLDALVQDWENATGTPEYYLLQERALTLYPKPDANATLTLDGFRRPESSLETPERLHESLAYWVLYRLYSQQGEKHNPQLAQLNLEQFNRAFGAKRKQLFDSHWRNMPTTAAAQPNPFN